MRTPTVVVCWTLLLASGASGQIARDFVQDLGSFGPARNQATALSGDGAVVVGYGYDASPWGPDRAFRWTAATGMQEIGTLGGPSARAKSVSFDGDTIVGHSTVPSGNTHAFRWVRGVGMQDLGTLGGTYASARDVSADGQVVVGMATLVSFGQRAFRWTEATGMVDIGTLGGPQARAHGVSGDGAVVVGWSIDAAGRFRAFRWTSMGGMIDLGTPLGGHAPVANAANSDGSVIVGHDFDNGLMIQRAFRWTAAGGMQWLDDLGGTLADATDVDSTGLVVVGSSDTPSTGNTVRAFRWTAATGAVELLGIPNPYSEPHTEAYGVSADGAAAVGYNSFSLLPWFDEELAIRWRWSTLGSVYCSAEQNSTGGPATLSAYGSLDVAHGDLALRAEGLPQGSWAFVLSSRDAGLTFPLPGSQGRLCLGGAFGRHNGAGEVKRTSGFVGSLEWILNPAAFPSPMGFVAVQPGETWHFQVWFRDANPGATSNLTDAIELTYQ